MTIITATSLKTSFEPINQIICVRFLSRARLDIYVLKSIINLTIKWEKKLAKKITTIPHRFKNWHSNLPPENTLEISVIVLHPKRVLLSKSLTFLTINLPLKHSFSIVSIRFNFARGKIKANPLNKNQIHRFKRERKFGIDLAAREGIQGIGNDNLIWRCLTSAA